MRVHFNRITGNGKTGPMATAAIEMASCPESCGMKFFCYGRLGPISLLFRAISQEDLEGCRYSVIDWDEFCGSGGGLVRKWVNKGQEWRYGVVGDLPGEGDRIDQRKLHLLVEANRGRKGFAYSHKPVGDRGQALINACAIRAANLNGFTISLSADNLTQADKLAAMGIAPVVAVVPMDTPRNLYTPGGLRCVVCPHEMNKEVQCIRCKLCARMDRKVIVCFRAHGSRKHKLHRHLNVIQQGQAQQQELAI